MEIQKGHNRKALVVSRSRAKNNRFAHTSSFERATATSNLISFSWIVRSQTNAKLENLEARVSRTTAAGRRKIEFADDKCGSRCSRRKVSMQFFRNALCEGDIGRCCVDVGMQNIFHGNAS